MSITFDQWDAVRRVAESDGMPLDELDNESCLRIARRWARHPLIQLDNMGASVRTPLEAMREQITTAASLMGSPMESVVVSQVPNSTVTEEYCFFMAVLSTILVLAI